jgi:hypothetical protein
MTMPAPTLTLSPSMRATPRTTGPLRRVAHVLAFDLLRLRWWLAAYAAVVGVAALHALEVPAFAVMHPVLLAFGVPLFTMVCAVVLVQGDHPTAPDAFWRGKPIAPWTQLASKLLLLTVLVLLPAMAIAVALGAIGAPFGTASTLAAQSARGLLLWAMLALATGAVTRDLRSAPLVLVVALVLAYGTRAFGGLAGYGPWWVGQVEEWAVIVGGGALVAALHHGVLSPRPALAITVLLGVAAMDAATREMTVWGRPPEPPTAAPATAAADAQPERLVIDTVDMGRDGSGAFALRYRVLNARANTRYAVQQARITLHYADGATGQLAMVAGGLLEAPAADIPLPAGAHWSTAPSDTLPTRGEMNAFVLTREIVRRPSSSIRRIEVRANLRRMTVSETLTVPWQSGDLVNADGQRLRLFDSTSSGNDRPRGWRLRWTEPRSTVEAERERYGDGVNHLFNTTLVQVDRNQVARPLRRQHVDHTSYPFILPWTARAQETLWLGVGGADGVAAVPANAAGSQLHVVRWKTAAVVPVQAEYLVGPGKVGAR